jgi:hypothetical protein
MEDVIEKCTNCNFRCVIFGKGEKRNLMEKEWSRLNGEGMAKGHVRIIMEKRPNEGHALNIVTAAAVFLGDVCAMHNHLLT